MVSGAGAEVIAARAPGDVFATWMRWERGQVGICEFVQRRQRRLEIRKTGNPKNNKHNENPSHQKYWHNTQGEQHPDPFRNLCLTCFAGRENIWMFTFAVPISFVGKQGALAAIEDIQAKFDNSKDVQIWCASRLCNFLTNLQQSPREVFDA